MSFEFYEGSVSEGTAPKITVRKGGQLVLTSGAVEMLGDDIEFVQLGLDHKTGVVGIRAATEDAKGRYRLRAQKNSESRLVTGKRFFAHNDLTIEKAQTYDAEEFEGGIVGFKLIEELAEPEPKVETVSAKKTGGRRKAKAA